MRSYIGAAVFIFIGVYLEYTLLDFLIVGVLLYFLKRIFDDDKESSKKQSRPKASKKQSRPKASKKQSRPKASKKQRFIVIQLEQGSKEWLDWRHSGIGASDASTIVGDNRFQSPAELFHQKKNKLNTVPNEKMIKGTKLEPEARRLYIEETGIKMKPLCLQDKKYPWMIASMDGISDDYKKIVEIKCGESAYWQARRGIVPDYYYGQLQHQLMITGLEEVDYWCYWPGQRSVLQTVERNETYIKNLFKTEQVFMGQFK